MNMAEGSVAEIMGEDGSALLQKFENASYALAKKTGLIDLEITSLSGVATSMEVHDALLDLADELGVHQITVRKSGTFVVHLYFYPKEET